MKNTKRMVLLALMVSQALILSIVESWIPMPFAYPGVKLGLANIVTMVALVFFSFKEVLALVCIRVVLSSIYAGGLIVFLFSITGGILSAIVMYFLYRYTKVFSIIGISIAGAVTHNIGQMMVASLIMQELTVFAYFPILLVSGIITGVFVGLCSLFLSNALRKTGIL